MKSKKYDEFKPIELYKYQVEYLKNAKPCYLFDCDTGTGKTIMSLYHYKVHFYNYKLLIVAPASKIKEGGWQRTIQETMPYIQYNTCSYNNLKKYYNANNNELHNYFIIFDECHRLKNSVGVWGKYGFLMSQKAAGFILLSATPIPNGWEDAINYFKIFNLVKNKTQFFNEFANVTTRYGYIEVLNWKYEDKLKSMWSSISHRLSKGDCLELPDLVKVTIYFKVSKDYKTIKKDRVFKDELLDNQMVLRHALRLNTNLKDKTNYVKEFVDNTTDNIIIFYNYVEEYKQLKKIIQKNKNKTLYVCNGIKKEYPTKEEWDNVHNTVTLANYKSGSEAVEFTYGNIIIYFSPTDSYTEYYQSEGRCYRNGQKKKVTVYKFITKNTIEENIYIALENKQDFNFKIWEKKEGLAL